MVDRRRQGVLDTSVIIDLAEVPEDRLPVSSTLAAITLAELSAGLHTTDDAAERAGRAERLQTVESHLDALPFDSDAARRYGRLVALTIASGRSHRPRRMDLMIAATAAAHDLPLYTRNPRDFEGLEAGVTVVAV